MTLTGTHELLVVHAGTPTGWLPRTELELIGQQLRAVDAFHATRRQREQDLAALSRTREMRLDADRALGVLRREHEAVVSRTHEQLRGSGDVLHAVAERRVVLAHRSEWFLDRVARTLELGGARVVARLDNGADAVGCALAEQPDLLLVEDALAMVRGEEVVRELRRYAPDTLVSVQIEHGDRGRSLLAAGATSVFTRQVPPLEVSHALLRLIAL